MKTLWQLHCERPTNRTHLEMSAYHMEQHYYYYTMAECIPIQTSFKRNIKTLCRKISTCPLVMNHTTELS